METDKNLGGGNDFHEIQVIMDDYMFSQKDLNAIDKTEKETPGSGSECDETLRFARKRKRYMIYSDSESDEEQHNILNVTNTVSQKWFEPTNRQKTSFHLRKYRE